jgi:outer membrane protein
MKSYKLFIISILIGVSARAQQTDPVLSQLIGQAQENYPAIGQQQQALLLAQSREQLTRSQYLPVLAADASYTYVDPVAQANFVTPIPDFQRQQVILQQAVLQFQPHNNYNTALNGSWIAYDFGRTKASLLRNQFETQAAKDNIESVRHTLAYQVANLYYGIVYLQKAIALQESQLKLLNENQKVISNRIKSGDEIDFNLITTQVRYKNTQTRLIDLESQLEKQYIALSNLTGKEVRGQISQEVAFAWSLNEITPENALSKAQENNWDLKILKEREKAASQDILIAGRGFYPSLSFSGSVGYKNGIQPDINQFRFNTALGARLSIPIYNASRNRLQQGVARINLQFSKYTTQSQALTLKTGIEQAITDLKAIQQKLDLSDAQVEQASYAIKLADSRYKNGVITSLEQLTAQTQLEEARLNRLQFEYQLVLAKLELNRLAGVKFW